MLFVGRDDAAAKAAWARISASNVRHLRGRHYLLALRQSPTSFGAAPVYVAFALMIALVAIMFAVSRRLWAMPWRAWASGGAARFRWMVAVPGRPGCWLNGGAVGSCRASPGCHWAIHRLTPGLSRFRADHRSVWHQYHPVGLRRRAARNGARDEADADHCHGRVLSCPGSPALPWGLFEMDASFRSGP